MNNEQFRRLVLDQPDKRAGSSKPEQNNDNNNNASQQTDSRNRSSPTTTSGVLGSRVRAGIPMTPRNVRSGGGNNNGNIDFARQLAEHRREEEGQQHPAKRFKSSAAPKGTKLASGYQDRTVLRRQQEKEDEERERQQDAARKEDVEQRLKALEDMRKLGQISQGVFEKLRREIGVGGDLKSTHLVKGLDWDLLRRAKAGDEDLTRKMGEEDGQDNEDESIQPEDVEDELDRMLGQQEEDQFAIPLAPKEKKVKKGNLATAAPPPGKLSRDQILQQLKASRAAAAAAAAQHPEPSPESNLSNKFKKIDKSEKKRWIETDASSGRRKEILIITDAEGNTKRKVRWLDKAVNKKDSNGLLLPDQDVKPMGMDVPDVVLARIAAEKAAEAEAEDDDIFAGVGTDYNPLADLEDEDDENSEDEKETKEDHAEMKREDKEEPLPEHAAAAQQPIRRNYFNDSKAGEDVDGDDTRGNNPLTSDPTLLAALKRAAALRQTENDELEREGEDDDIDEDPDRLARRKKFLEEARRRDAQDALDLDYGFGSSRIEDEEDEEGPTFGDGDQQRGSSNKRKRGPKRKGDKDSAADVLRVMEGRKK